MPDQKIQDIISRGIAAGLDDADISLAVEEYKRTRQESKPPKQQQSAARRFVGGAWEMANPIEAVKNIAGMVMDPPGAYESMVDQSAQQFVKSKEAYDQGEALEPGAAKLKARLKSLGYSVAGTVPMFGPMAADITEQAADGDWAGAAGRLTGLFAGPKVARGITRRVLPSAQVMEASAATRVADVMSPKTGSQVGRRMAAKAQEIAPEILKENSGGWSRAGLHRRVSSKLTDAEGALDEATDARLAARAIDTQPILDALNERRNALTAQASEASLPQRATTTRASAIVDESGRPIEVTTSSPVAYGEDVIPQPSRPRADVIAQAASDIRRLGATSTYEPLRRIRQSYDGPAKVVYNPSLVDDFIRKQGEAKGAADVTGALRDTLAKADPATASANARYSLYRNADDIMQAAKEVEQAKPRIGQKMMARLFSMLSGGSVAGVPGAATGFVLSPALDAMLNSGVTTKLQTARILKMLAERHNQLPNDVGSIAQAALLANMSEGSHK